MEAHATPIAPRTVVLVADRLRYHPVLEPLAERYQFWGHGAAAGEADRHLKEVLEDPPDLSKDTVFFVDLHPRSVRRAVDGLAEAYPRIPLLLDRRSAKEEHRHGDHVVVDVERWFREWTHARCDMAAVRARVEQLQTLLEDRKELLVLTHPNPDPDAIAAALGMRTVLGRNRQTATLGYLGRPLARPENRAMVELLEIDLERVTEDRLGDFDAIILVDCQENLFAKYDLPGVTAVIDHHPEKSQYTTPYRDVIPEEGSTSTIITRYLQALQIEPSQRLATALLYGVKSDTFFLKREVNQDDIESFMYLYPRANVNTLRRIEVPEVPLDGMRAMGEALTDASMIDGVFVAPVTAPEPSEDLVARLSDLGLQVSGAQWSLSHATVGEAIVASVRNVGYVRHAGRAVDEAFGRFGPAGGHRSAARAIMDLEKVCAEAGTDDPGAVGEWLLSRFLDVVRPEDEPG